MKQILHIFYKDIRHFWGEIAISLTLLAAFAWIVPDLWRKALIYEGQHSFYTPLSTSLIAVVLMFLIPISWWLLITRVVHEERLAGDRQFWITRPYEWHKLLATKTLLVICFVYLPLAVAQWWMLAVAGLHPASYISALFYDWMLLTALPILPIAALAAVTRNFARMVLTLLGAFVASAAMTAILLSLHQNGMLHSPIDNHNHLDVPLGLVFCSAVVLLAYARRRITLGQILLFVLPVLLFLSQAIFSTDAMINHDYPEIGSAGIQLSLNDSAQNLESAHVAISPRQLYIQIPLRANGIAPGDLWVGKGVRVTINADGQTLWVSPWQPLSFYLLANGDTIMGFNVDRTVYDRVQPQPVTLHVEIALDQAHREHVEASRISLRDVAIPGVGICSTINDPTRPELIDGKPTPTIQGLTCRSAMRQPRLTYVEEVFTRGLCQAPPGDAPSPTGVESTWIGNLNNEPAELSIAPVKVVPLIFSPKWAYDFTDKGTMLFQHLCPGAPITFTRYGLVRQLRTEFTIPNFQFPAYDKREDEAR